MLYDMINKSEPSRRIVHRGKNLTLLLAKVKAMLVPRLESQNLTLK